MCKEGDSEEVKTYKCAVTNDQLQSMRKSRVSDVDAFENVESLVDLPAVELTPETTSADRIVALEEQAASSQKTECERLNHIAEFHIAANNWNEAKDLLDRALMVSDEWFVRGDFQTMAILYNLTRVELLIGSQQRSKELAERLLSCQLTMLGLNHIEVAETLEHLATINQGQRHFGWSEMQYKKAIWIKEQLFGPEHHQIALLMRKLASLHYDKQDYAVSKSLLTKVLEMRKSLGCAQDEELGSVFHQLANVYYAECNYARSENYYNKALRLRKKLHGRDSVAVAETLGGLGKVFCATRRFEKAERSLNHALRNQTAVFGEHHKEVGTTLARLSGVHRAQGRFERANLLRDQAMACTALRPRDL